MRERTTTSNVNDPLIGLGKHDFTSTYNFNYIFLEKYLRVGSSVNSDL